MWWEGGYVIHNTVNYPYIFRCLPKMFRFRCFSFRSVDLIVLLSFWEFFATYFLVFWRKSKKVNYKKKFILRRVTRRGEGGEVSRRKKNIFFPCGAFLSCDVDEMFIGVSWFRENSPALKNSCLRAWFYRFLMLWLCQFI